MDTPFYRDVLWATLYQIPLVMLIGQTWPQVDGISLYAGERYRAIMARLLKTALSTVNDIPAHLKSD